MKGHSKFLLQYKVRLGLWLSLFFFILLLQSACRQKENISIVWEDNRARALVIAEIDDAENDQLQVRLKGQTEPVLGIFERSNDAVVFKPTVPLSAGAVYVVFSRNETIGSIQIPLPDESQKTTVVNIYPGTDTVPENLLKMYMQFSAPMREGEALQYIHLLDENQDTVPAVFLDLQPELWNKERTALTLWLDPGRIKRDLIPNLKMGNPLKKGSWYTLVISSQWRDVRGIGLKQRVEKRFFVGERDDTSPQLQTWAVQVPKAATKAAVEIKPNETLDYFLLMETIKIVNEKNETVAGELSIADGESNLSFIPHNPWQKGRYRMRVASHLEDLAGNNLNKPFDRDIELQKNITEKTFFEREFTID